MMKFDEKRWRYMAKNKPDELHSYIPQSSIIELFDEIERLEKENFKLKEANEDVQSRLDDYRQDYATVVNDQCPTDERHCGCVPILRRENRILSEDLENAKDELKHRRDALIDAQNIYNDANNHRMRYLTALELIASFASAKDKTSIDDLVAIARKELNCSSDGILDACNYWVSKLRDVEDELRDAKLKPKII
jgi:predicted RNase H-like nuclease (RuvC/YqgF family)